MNFRRLLLNFNFEINFKFVASGMNLCIVITKQTIDEKIKSQELDCRLL